jgi:uncharacterized coiled-coil protein SlyX
MSNFSSIRNEFEKNSNRNRDAPPVPPRPVPQLNQLQPRTETRSPPRPLLDEILARQGRTSSSRESTETLSPRRPVIDSSYRLPVFSSSRDELSNLKEDILRLRGTLDNVQAMLLNMYQRIEYLEERRQSPQHPTRPPFYNPSQPNHPTASYSSSVPNPVMHGGSLEEKYIKYKSKYNKLKNKLI